MCTALVVGNTIGIGIFVLPASLAPYGFNAMLGWGITVLGMTMIARVFAQLAREFPSADGPHAYIERTTGSLPAFFAIWGYWVSCWITNAAHRDRAGRLHQQGAPGARRRDARGRSPPP